MGPQPAIEALPAGALATDAAIDHGPLMAIDRDPKTFWQSEPDGATPKSLTVDMKDLRLVTQATVSVPEGGGNVPVRAELLGSQDGEFWFHLAGEPAVALDPASMVRLRSNTASGSLGRVRQWVRARFRVSPAGGEGRGWRGM